VITVITAIIHNEERKEGRKKEEYPSKEGDRGSSRDLDRPKERISSPGRKKLPSTAAWQQDLEERRRGK
jgi:hypothetical protein